MKPPGRLCLGPAGAGDTTGTWGQAGDTHRGHRGEGSHTGHTHRGGVWGCEEELGDPKEGFGDARGGSQGGIWCPRAGFGDPRAGFDIPGMVLGPPRRFLCPPSQFLPPCLTTQSVRVPHCSKWLRRLSSVVSKLRPPMKSFRSCSGSFGDCGDRTGGNWGHRGWGHPKTPLNTPQGSFRDCGDRREGNWGYRGLGTPLNISKQLLGGPDTQIHPLDTPNSQLGHPKTSPHSSRGGWHPKIPTGTAQSS